MTRTVRPAFLEWARALEEVSAELPPAGGDGAPHGDQTRSFHARVRLEAARRHALRVCANEAVDGHPRVRDVMVYLSWSPESAGKSAPTGEIAAPLPKPASDGERLRH